VDDVNILGRKFTWYHPNGRAMSRLDRMLISEEWVQQWGSVVVQNILRGKYPLKIGSGRCWMGCLLALSLLRLIDF